MSSSTRPQAVLALLKNPQFRKEAYAVIRKVAAFAERHPDGTGYEAFASTLAQRFINRWGVLPPHASELVDPDPRRPLVEAIAAGRWGIVPIFGWTTDEEIRAAVKRIRRSIGKQHRDVQNRRRAQLARWLTSCSFSSADIARAVWGRTRGLRRPTTAQAIRQIPEQQERQWLQGYRARGLSVREAEQRVLKRVRGSEAKASAAVRMAVRRYVETIERLNVALASPVAAEARSYALTMLFRALADQDAAEVRRRAVAARRAFLEVAAT